MATPRSRLLLLIANCCPSMPLLSCGRNSVITASLSSSVTAGASGTISTGGEDSATGSRAGSGLGRVGGSGITTSSGGAGVGATTASASEGGASCKKPQYKKPHKTRKPTPAKMIPILDFCGGSGWSVSVVIACPECFSSLNWRLYSTMTQDFR